MKSSLVCLILVLCSIIGCGGSSDPMVGTWKLQPNPEVQSKMPAGESFDATVEFKADKTFTVNMAIGSRKDELEGTYTLDGKTLTMTTTKEGGKPSNEKPETVTLSDDMKSFEMPGGIGKIVKQ